MAKLFIVTGPSGAGKNAVLNRAEEQGYRFHRVVTYSTRPMRRGESQGLPYHFVSEPVFHEMIASGDLLEWAKVHQHFYGNSRRDVERALKGDEPVILEIDPQGSRTVRKLFPDAMTIFLMPPSLEVLEQRIRRRRSEDEKSFQLRFGTAKQLLHDTSEWDVRIVNEEGNIDQAVQELMISIQVERSVDNLEKK